MRYAQRSIGQRFGTAVQTAALALVLLVAEAFALTHPFDQDAHQTDEPCKICISVAAVDSAAVAKAAAFSVDNPSPSLAVTAAGRSARTRLVTQFARGPPLPS
jgi:hypothetical protein